MSSSARPVNPRRSYDGTRRREKAQRTRELVIDVAERLFRDNGYGATTVATIAEQSGVSVDTVYKAFGGKAGLVRAIYARALQGSGPVPAYERSEAVQAREADARNIVHAWAGFVTEIAPRAIPILLMVRSAAVADPELASLIDEFDAERLDRMRDNARRLETAGHLRPGISVNQAADILWTYSSPVFYELLVLRRGMPIAEFERFIADAMIAALL